MTDMKRIFEIIAASAICILAANGCKNVVTFEAMPVTAQTFIGSYFPETPASYAVKDFFEYEVVLANGAEIEFNRKGEWKKIDMHHGIVPAGVLATLPVPVSSYLNTSFPNIPVEKVEKDFLPAYKLELVNGIELEFNSKGLCRDIDD